MMASQKCKLITTGRDVTKMRSNEEFEMGAGVAWMRRSPVPQMGSSLAGEGQGVQRISGAHKHILLSIKHIS